MLTHEEIEQHADLGAAPPNAIEEAVREHESDWIALLPTESSRRHPTRKRARQLPCCCGIRPSAVEILDILWTAH